jgi:hypothetical protein
MAGLLANLPGLPTLPQIVCFANGSVCIPLLPGNLSQLGQDLFNQLQGLTFQPVAPPKDYATVWLIGVVVSLMLIAGLLIWALLRSQIAHRQRHVRIAEHYDAKDIERALDSLSLIETDALSLEFSGSAVQVTTRPAPVLMLREPSILQYDLSALSLANPNAETLKFEFVGLGLRLKNGTGKGILRCLSLHPLSGNQRRVLLFADGFWAQWY